MKKLFKCVCTLWNNYERTDEVFRLYDLTPKWINRRLIRRLEKLPKGRSLLAGELRSQGLEDKQYLLRFPEGTLGRALGEMKYPTLYGFQRNYSPLATAFVDVHDPLHVLTGYGTSAYDEACLQAFSFHHLPVPAPLIIAIGFALANPRSIPDIYRGYKWGKKVPWLILIKWDEYLDNSVSTVKKELRI